MGPVVRREILVSGAGGPAQRGHRGDRSVERAEDQGSDTSPAQDQGSDTAPAQDQGRGRGGPRRRLSTASPAKVEKRGRGRPPRPKTRTHEKTTTEQFYYREVNLNVTCVAEVMLAQLRNVVWLTTHTQHPTGRIRRRAKYEYKPSRPRLGGLAARLLLLWRLRSHPRHSPRSFL